MRKSKKSEQNIVRGSFKDWCERERFSGVTEETNAVMEMAYASGFMSGIAEFEVMAESMDVLINDKARKFSNKTVSHAARMMEQSHKFLKQRWTGRV